LREAGIEVEVVSGISSGLAAPASIGIPLTHRDWSAGAIFVTGHERADKRAEKQAEKRADKHADPRIDQSGDSHAEGASGKPDWALLAQTNLTLVIYMGVSRCREIARALQEGGKNGATPVAVIGSATGEAQSQLITTLACLADDLVASGIGSPAIIIVGDVVRCALLPGLSGVAEVAKVFADAR
jgi:uroporphyrin-III C-methyltransferase